MDYHKMKSLDALGLPALRASMASITSAYLFTLALDPRQESLAFQQAKAWTQAWHELELWRKQLNSQFSNDL